MKSWRRHWSEKTGICSATFNAVQNGKCQYSACMVHAYWLLRRKVEYISFDCTQGVNGIDLPLQDGSIKIRSRIGKQDNISKTGG